MPLTLPIDEFLPQIRAILQKERALVISAEPGAGKSTRVPPALIDAGPVILLQPRRVAARSLARWIAAEQGWALGEEVGWQVRFDRRYSARTRLLVATEGILTARLQSDPLLSEFTTIVLDEFHERSIHTDLAIALAREALAARDDLRLVVMSATLDTAPLRSYLGGCPLLEVPGRTHPVEIIHSPDATVAGEVKRIIAAAGGDVLCFLPGAREIEREYDALRNLAGIELHRLHGSLDADEQDAALAPSSRRKVILATNIAETSLTVEGVTDVVDSGMQRVMRFDAQRGLDQLVTERISAAAATQRSGRAGRTRPGRAFRLWSPELQLRPQSEPEIARVDLAPLLLDIAAWGGDSRSFGWFEAPPEWRIDAGSDLLERLGLMAYGRLTPFGSQLKRLPLHPRLAVFLNAAGVSRRSLLAAALLSEGRRTKRPSGGTMLGRSDLLFLLDEQVRERGSEPVRMADQLERIAREVVGAAAAEGGRTSAVDDRDDDEQLMRAAYAAWPDRLARRREQGSNRFLLASGRGAQLSRESGVQDADLIVAIEVTSSDQTGSEALIRMASAVEREWITGTQNRVEHSIDDSGRVRAVELEVCGSVVIRQKSIKPDASIAQRLLAERLTRGELPGAAERLFRRASFAGIDLDREQVIFDACAGVNSLGEVNLLGAVPFEVRQRLERLAPEWFTTPAGRKLRIDYAEDLTPSVSVRLQEMFGVTVTPQIGPRATPLTFFLLAPNMRPVQTTRDLRSFWERTYAEVRKELRGRYPKHKWPEDPSSV
jgi:ATP-dependent helicase HrpB